jgi:predicted amidohydrolase YtcJ
LAFDHAPVATEEDRKQWYVDAIAMQNAVGITEIHNMDGNVAMVDVFEDLENNGRLNLRALVHHFVYPYTDEAEVAEMIATKNRRGSRWQADGVKFMLDGVIDTGTAWLEEPDSHGEGNEPMWPDVNLYHQRAHRFNDAGFRIATHAIGDRAVREVLDTYASFAGGSNGRHRIEHIETAPDATVARFKGEQVIASMQPIHMRWLDPDRKDPWSSRLDETRCSHGMRSGDLSAAGALVVLGSDWPVAPFDPRMGFFAAQLRRAHDVEDLRPIGSSRPLTGEEMIAGYTINSAKAVGAADMRGSLEVGKQADLVMWAEDPATCNPLDVVQLPVLMTVVGGQVVHQIAG